MHPVRWCFQCGIEYADGVSDCVECGVGLVDEAPVEPAEVGLTVDDQLAYELHEWAGESRRILDQLLTSQGIAHAWQGATLVVSEIDEVAEEQQAQDFQVDLEAARQTLQTDIIGQLGSRLAELELQGIDQGVVEEWIGLLQFTRDIQVVESPASIGTHESR